MSILDDEKMDAWLDDGPDPFFKPNLDSHISANPGRNYSTLAKWSTLCDNDYPPYGHPWASSHKASKPTGEVVIQIRNDLLIPVAQPINTKRYNFDDEMEVLLGENLQEFFDGIRSQTQQDKQLLL